MSSPTACLPSSGPSRRRVIRQLALLCCLATVAAGCATNAALRAGQLAESQQDYDRAVVEYTKVARDAAERPQRPGRARAGQAARRAGSLQPRAALVVNRQARRSARRISARRRAQPDQRHDRRTRCAPRASQLRAKIAVNDEGKTQLETLIQRSLDGPDARRRSARRHRAARHADRSARRAAATSSRAIGKCANISIVFDPTFRDQPITIDLRKVKLADALTSVAGATRNFWKANGQRTVDHRPRHAGQAARVRRRSRPHVLPEQRRSQRDDRHPAHRRRRAAPRADDGDQRHHHQGHAGADRGRRTDHQRASTRRGPKWSSTSSCWKSIARGMKEYGLQIASPSSDGSTGIDGQAAVNRDDLSRLRDLRNLTQAGVSLTNLPGLYYRLLKTDSATRVLANPQLRTVRRAWRRRRSFGERVPVPVTTFAPIASRRRAARSRSRRSTTRTSASTSTSRRARTTTTTCRWR